MMGYVFSFSDSLRIVRKAWEIDPSASAKSGRHHEAIARAIREIISGGNERKAGY